MRLLAVASVIAPRSRIGWSNAVELLSSMRFAISLLVFICLASLIGTIIPQNRPDASYIDQFGPFWFEVLDKFSIWGIYNNWWFLLTMAFLVVSTSLCLIRNTPKMLKDMRSFRESVRVSSLRAFHHKVELQSPQDLSHTGLSIEAWLKKQGYAVKSRVDEQGKLFAAKKGSGNRLGYICAHASIVIVCVGGLLDSELPVRLQIWMFGKTPIQENMLIADVPPAGRLSVDNPSFRANVLIPEGGERSSAVVNIDDGALVQPLPFSLKLKKFIVDYYSTGMPSRFASEVLVTDPDTGKTFDALIEVNTPLHFKGVTVYQSSFDDGGSKVELVGYPLSGTSSQSFDMPGRIGQQGEVTLGKGEKKLQVDFSKLRPINVEDLSGGQPAAPKPMLEHVAAVTGSAAGKKNPNLRNIGPSVEYRLIDDTGQAVDFHNYMLPVELDGFPVLLSGVKEAGQPDYRYLRIPADQDGSVKEFMLLRAALADPALRQEAARRFAQLSAPNPGDRQALQTSAERALDAFAQGGLQSISRFLEMNVPADELPRAADIVVRLLGSSVSALRTIARERAGLPPLDLNAPDKAEHELNWSRFAVAALSDLALYPAPIYFSLKGFDHVQASVFQVSRTPGKLTVYVGCLLLVIGVFAMFYVRDRRVWVWLKPSETGGTEVLAAMTSQKRTLDFEREFDRFKAALQRLRPGS